MQLQLKIHVVTNEVAIQSQRVNLVQISVFLWLTRTRINKNLWCSVILFSVCLVTWFVFCSISYIHGGLVGKNLIIIKKALIRSFTTSLLVFFFWLVFAYAWLFTEFMHLKHLIYTLRIIWNSKNIYFFNCACSSCDSKTWLVCTVTPLVKSNLDLQALTSSTSGGIASPEGATNGSSLSSGSVSSVCVKIK